MDSKLSCGSMAEAPTSTAEWWVSVGEIPSARQLLVL